MSELVYTLALWGAGRVDAEAWKSWLGFMLDTGKSFGAEVTHVGIDSKGFSNKALLAGLGLKRLRKHLDAGKAVSRVAGYSLPREYATVSFDYRLHMVRDADIVVVTASSTLGSSALAQLKKLGSAASKQINAHRGEIFEMDKEGVPLFYVFGETSPEQMASLRIVKSF